MSDLRPSDGDLSVCDREPIHIPGSIQPHGVLLALEPPRLTIRQVSANCGQLLGAEPEAVLGTPLEDWLAPEQQQKVVDSVLEAESGLINPLGVNLTSGTFCDGIAHPRSGLILLELENSGESASSVGRGVVDPYFKLVQSTLANIHSSETVEDMAAIVARQLRLFTGFDRSMVYRFAHEGHGEVIADDHAEGMESFLGLRYPANDIPAQARRLYVLNLIRTLVDADSAQAPLVPALNPLNGAPLDLSMSSLRSVSPVHLQYLNNMGVAATLTVSLLRGHELWGMMVCHHRTPRFMPYAIRAACLMFGTVMSAQLLAKEDSALQYSRAERQRLHTKVIEEIASSKQIFRGLANSKSRLLQLADASGAAICRRGDCQLIGKTPPEDMVRELAAWNGSRQDDSLFATDQLAEHYSPAAEHLDTACGLLALHLSSEDLLLIFRPEARHSVRWGGDPTKSRDDDQDQLTPRASFAEWVEHVKGRSRPWTDLDLEIARDFRTSLIIFIIGQTRELARINAELEIKNEEMQQFVYTVSHDLKSPLVSCQGFLGLLKRDLERGNIEQALDSANEVGVAARRMSNIIDDLLHLSRIGQSPLKPRSFDLDDVVQELVETLGPTIQECRARIVVEPGLPTVFTDRTYVLRALENLLSNALRYACDSPDSTITMGGGLEGQEVLVFVKDQGPGIDPEYHERIFGLFQRLHTDRDGTGVGLASVSRTMQRLGGRVWVESEPGKGATFWLSLPKRLSAAAQHN